MKASKFTDAQKAFIITPGEEGTPVAEVCREHGTSSASFYKWRSKYGGMDASLMADWLVALTTANKTWGFGLCFLHLRNVKGFGWNHKRVYRIYRELELNMRIKPRLRTHKRDSRGG